MTSNHIKIQNKIPNQVRNLQHPQKPKIKTERMWMFFAPSNQNSEPKFRTVVYQRPLTIEIKIPNTSQEPPVPIKVTSNDLKDMDVICTFIIKIEIQKFGIWVY